MKEDCNVEMVIINLIVSNIIYSSYPDNISALFHVPATFLLYHTSTELILLGHIHKIKLALISFSLYYFQLISLLLHSLSR